MENNLYQVNQYENTGSLPVFRVEVFKDGESYDGTIVDYNQYKQICNILLSGLV